jgi:hypothetical protein
MYKQFSHIVVRSFESQSACDLHTRAHCTQWNSQFTGDFSSTAITHESFYCVSITRITVDTVNTVDTASGTVSTVNHTELTVSGLSGSCNAIVDSGTTQLVLPTVTATQLAQLVQAQCDVLHSATIICGTKNIFSMSRCVRCVRCVLW